MEETKCPYILFKVADSSYCVNSRYISCILQLPHYDRVPAAPTNVTRMFRYRDQIIQMLDLRITFGFKSMTEECEEFAAMIEARKQDHIGNVAGHGIHSVYFRHCKACNDGYAVSRIISNG